MTSMYPMPARARDERFNAGLIAEVAAVLELRGFPAVRTGSDLARLGRHLSAFLYDSGRPGPAAVQGVALPARSADLPPSIGGPGTPDDWPDYAIDHPAPSGHLVLPEPHPDPAVTPMPEQSGGYADYCSPKRLAWL